MIRQLTDSERSLISIAFSIAADKFKANALSLCVPSVVDQFNLQAKQIEELSVAFASVDSIQLQD